MTKHLHKGSHKNKKFISAKIRKIKKEGVRGRRVSQRQAIAIAFSIARRKHKRKRK